nr:PREDICTED: uncharacterized protein LOC107790417 [Nicotiana tabacum]
MREMHLQKMVLRVGTKVRKDLERMSGEVSSIHHKCFNRMQDLINQEQSIQSSFHKKSEKVKSDHRIRLNASVDVVRFLLRNGLSFRGHNESEDSEDKDFFLELLEFHGDKHSDVGKVTLHKAPKNDMIICPAIQKDIVDACAKETSKAIIQDLDDEFFGILVDESKDISHKEQMALVIQYVNKRGEVIERVLGIVHVNDSSALSLQKIIYDLLLDHSLSSSKLRGQDELNKALQKKDQDIVNAMRLLDLANIRLQTMRESEFEFLMNELHELNSRFDVMTSDLLLGMACLNPIDSFANFDKDRIMKLAKYYPSEFDDNKLRDLSFQLDSFIVYARMPHSKFINLKGMKDLAIVMAETKLDQT